MMKETNLYFVALVPPEPFFSRILRLKQEFADTYNSSAALKSPPHVTLHMPFRYAEKKEQQLVDTLDSFAVTHHPLTITQVGFGAFAPRVIFVNVEKTESLALLQSNLVREARRKLNLDNADYKNRGFHPHMTIAFRDLRKPAFDRAWNHYESRKIEMDWQAAGIILLKHNGKNWDIFKSFPLAHQKNS